MKTQVLKQIGYDPADLNFAYFDMKEVDYNSLELELVSLPFFADEKIVILDHFLDITTAKKRYLSDDELKAFEEYLENPSPTSKLVILRKGSWIVRDVWSNCSSGMRQFLKPSSQKSKKYELISKSGLRN